MIRVIFILGIIMTILGAVAHIAAYFANKIYRKKTLEKSLEKDDD